MPYITTAERVGIEKGLAEGLVKGREEGRQEGREEGLLVGIEAILELKFGTDGLAIMPDIRRLEDVVLLQKILQTAKTATNPEAVRRLWTQQP